MILNNIFKNTLSSAFFIENKRENILSEIERLIYFTIEYVKNIKKSYSPEDIQRTLLELTAISIAKAIKKYCSKANEIYVCGGGAKNIFLIEILKNKTNELVE